MPVGPDWLIEAIGFVQLDPGGQHEGPIARSDQNIEIRITTSFAMEFPIRA